MKELDEKDFEQAISNHHVTGKYTSKRKWVVDDIFENYTFKNLVLIKGSFSCSLFKNCTFINVFFESVHLDECDFKNCNFNNVTFKNCTTEGTEFTNCNNMPQIM